MRKYFTWRCIGLHVLVLIIVPTFFLLGRWQYHAARSGNTLSWAYTFEWPLFGLYAIYVWWRLIHEKSTALARLWAARDRTAAANSGMPLEEVPGWALDKELAKAVMQASLGSPGSAMLSEGQQTEALESHEQKRGSRLVGAATAGDHPEVIGAYNRYLAELNRSAPPKRW